MFVWEFVRVRIEYYRIIKPYHKLWVWPKLETSERWGNFIIPKSSLVVHTFPGYLCSTSKEDCKYWTFTSEGCIQNTNFYIYSTPVFILSVYVLISLCKFLKLSHTCKKLLWEKMHPLRETVCIFTDWKSLSDKVQNNAANFCENNIVKLHARTSRLQISNLYATCAWFFFLSYSFLVPCFLDYFHMNIVT